MLLYNNVAELRQKLVLKALIKKNNGMRWRIANFDGSLPCRADVRHGLSG